MLILVCECVRKRRGFAVRAQPLLDLTSCQIIAVKSSILRNSNILRYAGIDKAFLLEPLSDANSRLAEHSLEVNETLQM